MGSLKFSRSLPAHIDGTSPIACENGSDWIQPGEQAGPRFERLDSVQQREHPGPKSRTLFPLLSARVGRFEQGLARATWLPRERS